MGLPKFNGFPDFRLLRLRLACVKWVICKTPELLEGMTPWEFNNSDNASSGRVGWYNRFSTAGKKDGGIFSRSQVQLVPRRSRSII
jgi:hypothetical protein